MVSMRSLWFPVCVCLAVTSGLLVWTWRISGSLYLVSSDPLLSPPPGPPRKEIIFATIATRKYVSLAISSLESVRSHFMAEDTDGEMLAMTFYLLTDQVAQLTSPESERQAPTWLGLREIPDRDWPQSTLSKFDDLVSQLGEEIRMARYVYFLDADTRMVGNVTLQEISGRLVGVLHPYYPRDHRGFCGRYNDASTSNMGGFDKDGKFTFCQYPYERRSHSAAYISMDYGKLPPSWDHANSNYYQAAFFGGEGIAVLEMLITLRQAVKRDQMFGVVAGVHDESHLNRYFHDHDADVRALSYSFIYPEPPKDRDFNMDWLFSFEHKIYHVLKNENDLRTGGRRRRSGWDEMTPTEQLMYYPKL